MKIGALLLVAAMAGLVALASAGGGGGGESPEGSIPGVMDLSEYTDVVLGP